MQCSGLSLLSHCLAAAFATPASCLQSSLRLVRPPQARLAGPLLSRAMQDTELEKLQNCLHLLCKQFYSCASRRGSRGPCCPKGPPAHLRRTNKSCSLRGLLPRRVVWSVENRRTDKSRRPPCASPCACGRQRSHPPLPPSSSASLPPRRRRRHHHHRPPNTHPLWRRTQSEFPPARPLRRPTGLSPPDPFAGVPDDTRAGFIAGRPPKGGEGPMRGMGERVEGGGAAGRARLHRHGDPGAGDAPAAAAAGRRRPPRAAANERCVGLVGPREGSGRVGGWGD